MGKSLSSVSVQSLMLVLGNVANRFVIFSFAIFAVIARTWGLSRALSWSRNEGKPFGQYEYKINYIQQNTSSPEALAPPYA